VGSSSALGVPVGRVRAEAAGRWALRFLVTVIGALLGVLLVPQRRREGMVAAGSSAVLSVGTAGLGQPPGGRRRVSHRCVRGTRPPRDTSAAGPTGPSSPAHVRTGVRVDDPKPPLMASCRHQAIRDPELLQSGAYSPSSTLPSVLTMERTARLPSRPQVTSVPAQPAAIPPHPATDLSVQLPRRPAVAVARPGSHPRVTVDGPFDTAGTPFHGPMLAHVRTGARVPVTGDVSEVVSADGHARDVLTDSSAQGGEP
jgi:hypothetical protein